MALNKETKSKQTKFLELFVEGSKKHMKRYSKFNNLKDEYLFFLLLYTVMRSITTVIQIYMQKQADSVVSDTNRFINFWLLSMGIRGERHNSYYADPPT